jgi:hypothetical protein
MKKEPNPGKEMFTFITIWILFLIIFAFLISKVLIIKWGFSIKNIKT